MTQLQSQQNQTSSDHFTQTDQTVNDQRVALVIPFGNKALQKLLGISKRGFESSQLIKAMLAANYVG